MNNNAFLRLPQVIQRVGLSRSTIYGMIKAGRFCRPVQIGIRAVGWLAKDIDAWIESRVTAPAATKSEAHNA